MKVRAWYMFILFIVIHEISTSMRDDLTHDTSDPRSKENIRSLLDQRDDQRSKDQDNDTEDDIRQNMIPIEPNQNALNIQDLTNTLKPYESSLELDSNNSSKKIPDFCKCNEQKTGTLRCICKARSPIDHWPLENILKFLPQNMSMLYLYEFNFGVLQNNSFKQFPKLKHIRIQKCNLTAVEVNAFEHFKEMENNIIMLNDNNIKYIEPGAFRHGRSIRLLHLDKNYNMGLANARNVMNDLENKPVEDIRLAGCGLVIDTIDGTFFKTLNASNLKVLHIHGNSIKTLAPDAFEPIKSLRVLILSNFMYVSTLTFNVLQNLTHFKLYGGLQKSFGQIVPTLDLNELQHLKILQLSLSHSANFNLKISYLRNLKELLLIDAQDFEGYRGQMLQLLNNSQSLSQVDLSGNLLFQYTDMQLCQLFENKIHFTSLNLARNYLSHLPNCIFRGMVNLIGLVLFKNRIFTIQKDLFTNLQNLLWLDLSDNAITFIDPGNFAHMPDLRELYIHHNNFDCNCELTGLRDILKTWGLHVYHDEKCSRPESRKHAFVHNYTIPEYLTECNSKILLTSCSTTGSIILFLTILTSVLLKHFWKDIKYIKMVRKARKRGGYAPIHNEPIEDDAFVSYHSEKTLWVQRDLCRELENGEDIKFTLMYDDRIMPGGSFFTSLGNAMYSCRKILFVVSRGWVAAALNQFEVDMALVKLLDDNRDMIIVLLMEHIPKAEMSDTLRMMVKHNTCLKWSDNERQQAKFWRDLKLELGKHHLEEP